MWTRNKADLFYVALEEKSEPTGGNQVCTHLSAVYGRDFKHWMERGHQALEVMLWSLEVGDWKVWSLPLGMKLWKGF